MIKFIPLFIFFTLEVFAGEKGGGIPAYVALSAFIAVVGLFFWGIYKAVKTQKTIYTLALLPFVILILWMFFI
jgi:O-antigen ligase